jgi:protocatechuate 3,4-dioxygenase beta subunit
MESNWSPHLRVTRRGFLLAGTTALICRKGISATPACQLTPEQEVGPYYIDDALVRADLTEGKPGLPLTLRIAVVDSRSCAPLPHAAVDIWHCDALGLYSGFTANSPDGGRGPREFRPPDGLPPGPPPGMPAFPPGMPPGRGRGAPPAARISDSSRFLRGLQITDKQGLVEFATLYPGWYAGRAIHVHLKAHIGGAAAGGRYSGGHISHTGQMFFPEDITEAVAKTEPYSRRLAVHRTTQEEDGIFNSQHGSASMLAMSRRKPGTNADGFLATVTLAVDPEATPAPVGMTRGPGRRM